MITKEQINELSKKFSIDWYSIVREYLQIIFLSSLYQNKLSQDVFFKGGTAIRLLFNSFRFSEDLDFTSTLSYKSTENLIEETIEKTSLILPSIDLKKEKTLFKSFSGSLRYNDSEHKHPVNVHLEISLREKPLTKKETVLETLFPVSPNPIIVHFSKEEILAEKTRALMTRAQGRDLFDIWYLLSKDTGFDLKLINKKMELHDKKITLEDVLDKIKSFKEEKIETDLNKYLPSTHRKISTQIKEMLLDKLNGQRKT